MPTDLMLKRSWVEITAYGWDDWWFRILGRGLSLKDHREYPALFTERNSGRYGVEKTRYIHIGPYCLQVLGYGD